MSRREIEILSVDKLLAKQFPQHESMLGNLIDKGGAVLVSGPQKVGKSLLATQLALSIADRRAFLGFQVGNAEYRVLALQAEVTPKRMQERFQKQAAGFLLSAQERVLNGCVFSSLKLDNKDDESTILAWVDLYKPDLLIIDHSPTSTPAMRTSLRTWLESLMCWTRYALGR